MVRVLKWWEDWQGGANWKLGLHELNFTSVLRNPTIVIFCFVGSEQKKAQRVVRF